MIKTVRVQGMRSIADSGTLNLGPITVLVGRNNSGKSSLLRSLYLLQEGHPWAPSDIRLGQVKVEVDLTFDKMVAQPRMSNQMVDLSSGVLRVTKPARTESELKHLEDARSSQGGIPVRLFPALEPQNLVYPSFTRSWPIPHEEQVRRDAVNTVRPDVQNLVSRVSTMSDPRVGPGLEFEHLYQRVLGDTTKLSILTGDNGQRIASQIDRFTAIGLDAMGTGVGSVLNLLVNLTGASGKLFLIEEPENDLHPEALKALLDVLVERSADNQFVISTHSNIVVSRLGATSSTKIIEVTSDGGSPPTSTFKEISSRSERLGVLRTLGYELADMDISEGWIIFEESSAERICRSFLIPWFVPRLAKLQTVAAAGTSRVPALVQNFAEMMLFAHLEPAYSRRAWVVVDGEPSGDEVISRLRQRYPDWPDNRFMQWDKANFEEFYPAIFAERVAAAIALPKEQRRDAKSALLSDVIQWCSENPDEARIAFEESALSVIATLRSIEDSLAPSGSD